MTEDQWVRALDWLLDDPDHRLRMGAEGGRGVEDRYSAELQAPRVRALLSGLPS